MRGQKRVYIIGHKNPDTDSICSAIAYADIKNRTTSGKVKYVARRAGQINEETQYVLNRFGIEAPPYLGNVGTQVKDMDIRTSPDVNKHMPVRNAWNLMRENGIVTLPIKDENGTLEGLITIGDIAQSLMCADNYTLGKARTQYLQIAQTLDARVVAGDEEGYFENGKVLVGALHPDRMKEYIGAGDLVILGNREEDHLKALEEKASCLVICLDSEVSERVLKVARQQKVTIIVTPFDTFAVARTINQSIPLRYLMRTENLVTFHTEDFTDSIQDVMVKNRHRAFPVISKHGKCIGTISRRNFLGMHKKEVILVDHNERSQAVDNIDSAQILEIIDHHKLGNIETMAPVMFRNLPVGCTGTIMYQMYNEARLEITPQIAGLLCAAIISDTLMFRSPTCTIHDKMAAGALALIADIEIESFAKEMFHAGSSLKDKSSEEIFYQDYKKFISGEQTFGVGQISSMEAEELGRIKEKLIPFMKSEYGRNGVSSVYFMLTNILEESTELIFYGENCDNLLEEAFHVKAQNRSVILPGVVSRKKQLIPALMEAMQDIYS
ncbi:putative manganese-dependent inorganic diphosphatase [Blautia hydrogenotrophica]|uniref:putative manganese-dependent inorganic diphosphatase n=1 Tax=Blautia hydrogenotrophica TaxID=53443 RepID=UPI002E7A2D0A|nr:putative manganese-dependent inorganic diphosphatase [Blautia hydrogenotrophica]MEE0462325.1 putative manganese-dependent inorganic diphosphatase [Blautia hydrogenotrophica]